jgi:hypothetical protein
MTVVKLDQASIDALSDDDFAVPSQRKLRINDVRHTKLAWKNIEAAQGLTANERADARRRILARAAQLDIDVSDWHKTDVIFLEAMSLNISNSDHPNKMPFSGILVRLDQPSDAAPGGAHGRKIIVTAEAAERALHSLLGMAIDFTPSFDGHDAQSKIGIITSADVVGNAVKISGFVYAADFPETALLIKELKDVLGFSFEAQRLTIQDRDADILTITDLYFTGAAILLKDKAAYKTTKLAAKAVKGNLNMTPEELKKILDDAMKTVGDRLTKIEAGATAAVTSVTAPAALDVKAIVAEAFAAQAEVTKIAAAQADALKVAVDTAVAAATKPLMDKIAAAETVAADAAAKVLAAAAAPERKTVSPMITSLLARAQVVLPEGDAKLKVAELDVSLKAAGLSMDQRMTLKQELTRAGVL